MTQTPRRSGIRLPWSHEEELEAETQTSEANGSMAPGATGAAPTDATGSATPHQTEAVVPAPLAEEPNEADNALLASLVAAMHEVAERERATSVSTLKTSVDEAIERLRERAAEGAEQLRSRADLDTAGIAEWVRAEIDRIQNEGRTKTETRRQQLEAQLNEHEQQSQAEIDAMQARVAAYERELTAFFAQLHEISDPAAFGTAAKRMPRPPALGARIVGPVAPPPAASEPVAEPAAPAAAAAPDGAAPDAAAGTDATEPASDEATAPEEMQAAGDAMESTEPAPAVDESRQPDLGSGAGAALETLRDRMDRLGISREPAAAPGEAPEPADADVASSGSSAEGSGLAARLAELDARLGEAPSGETTTATVPAPGGESATAIMVSGLGSFGAITSFKQALERVEGVHGISLSLGPTGEFVYRATHDAGFDLVTAIGQIERGTATIDRQADGSLRVTVQRAR